MFDCIYPLSQDFMHLTINAARMVALAASFNGELAALVTLTLCSS